MPSETTRVFHDNALSVELAAANRIYENGSGVALGDFDGDGWCDVYVCGLAQPNRLYRNLGQWRFEEVTGSSPLACSDQFSTGAAWADVDGDGDLDLLVNGIGAGTRLFRNEGKGQFSEVQNSGLLRQFGATSLALSDIDRDGDLDLYVTNYRTSTAKDNIQGLDMGVRMVDGKPTAADPERFQIAPTRDNMEIMMRELGEPDFLYLNDGSGHFQRVSWTESGRFVDHQGNKLEAPPRDWGLSAMFRDFNGDGIPDLYVCNDFFQSPDRLWINDGVGFFRPAPPETLRSISLSSMALDVGDLNRDGWDDFFVVEMLSQSLGKRQRQRPEAFRWNLDLPLKDPSYWPEVPRNTLHANRGDGTYAEVAQWSGIEATEWSWSTLFLDVDLDGYEDILVTNGHGHDVLDADTLETLSRQARAKNLEEQIHNLELFPRLNTPNLAYRNLGNFRFQDRSQEWGFAFDGVSQGMALGDLDNDGDQDVVMTHQNAPVTLYRNNIQKPRIAIRLKGLGSNSRAIGARIIVRSEGLLQSQEIIGGGRYVSSDEPQRTFAVGTQAVNIEVHWTSGLITKLNQAPPNYLYEVNEPEPPSGWNLPRRIAPRDQPKDPENPTTLFVDASAVLNHTHREDAFDETQRQPLMDRFFDGLGPAVAWYDVDLDGWEDLVVGAGRGSGLGIFRNKGSLGGFTRIEIPPGPRDSASLLGWSPELGKALVLLGMSNYEDGSAQGGGVMRINLLQKQVGELIPGTRQTVGPMTMGDPDGDGDLDLFIGGRFLPGRYPEPTSSLFYRNEQGSFSKDDLQELPLIGQVSGALFTDLTQDGIQELVVVCQWGPIRIFQLAPFTLEWTDVSEDWGISDMNGLWNGVTAGDFDEDGAMDLILTNWGENTPYQRYATKERRLYYFDVDSDGHHEIIESCFDPMVGDYVAWRDRKVMETVFPWIQENAPTYRKYGEMSLKELMGEDLSLFLSVKANQFQSLVLLNRGRRFDIKPLPAEAQWSPAFGVSVGDMDGDGHLDAFLSQNFFDTPREVGRYDAGRGLLLKGNGKGDFEALGSGDSGIELYGQQRGCAVADFNRDGRLDLVVGQNQGHTMLYENKNGKPGLRVRVMGGKENFVGVGVQVRLMNESGKGGPLQEVLSGGGMGSQDGSVRVLTCMGKATHLWVRWVGGEEETYRLPENAAEVLLEKGSEIRVLAVRD